MMFAEGRKGWSVPLAILALVSLLLLDSPIWEQWENLFTERSVITLSDHNAPKDTTHVVIDDKARGKQEPAHPLGSFPYRPHYHETKSCSEIHKLSTTKPLVCEGIGRTQEETSCGGLRLEKGLCVMAEKAKFVYRHQNEDIYHVKKNPLCVFQTEIKYIEGSFSNSRYHGPKCELADLNPRWLHDKFEEQLIVFVGDSHARNLFTSFIAEVRNQQYVVERHPDTLTKDTLFPYQLYQVGMQSDYLRDLTGSRTLTADSVRKSCTDSGCCSLTVLYLWAGFPEEYEALLKGALRDIKPDVVITDFVSKAYTADMGFETALNRTSLAWEQFFTTHQKEMPLKFIVSPFPLFGGDAIKLYVSNWLKTKRLNMKSLVLDQTEFLAAYGRTGSTLEQLKHTSHSVCGLYDTFSLDANLGKIEGGFKVVGYESCVAPIDRAVVRVALTFASQT